MWNICAYPVVRGWDSLIQFDQKVAYPIVFDAYDFCTPELKEQLAGPRKVKPPPSVLHVTSEGRKREQGYEYVSPLEC